MAHAMSPFYYNDDVLQQIWPFLQRYDGSLLKNDFIAHYYLDCFPIGYKAFYTLGSSWMDPRVLSKILPYPLLGIVLLGLGMAGYRMAGRLGCWFSLAVGLGAGIWLDRMTGGLPRAFGFPFLVMIAVGVICARPLLLAVTTALAALFYPVASVFGGVLLAIYLLLLPAADRQLSAGWTLKRRLGLVAVTGVLCVAAVLPVLLRTQQYTPTIHASGQKAFPEIGPAGRYLSSDRPPYTGYLSIARRVSYKMSGPVDHPWPYVSRWVLKAKTSRHIVIASFFGGVALLALGVGVIFKGGKWRRLALFLFVSVFLCLLARQVAPELYLPSRYVIYSLPVCFTLALSGGAAMFGRWVGQYFGKPRVGTVLSMVVCFGCLVLLMPRGSSETGFTYKRTGRHPAFQIMAQLPRTTCFAGWPTGLVQHVPYLTGRSILLSYEVHQAFHQVYTLEMRRRMKALIRAFFARDLKDLVFLRDTFGVTHLIVDMRYWTRCPRYFEPFRRQIKQAFEHSRAREVIGSQIRNACIYRDRRFLILDLRRLRSNQSEE